MVHALAALARLTDGLADQVFAVPGGFRATAGEAPDLVRNHRETGAGAAGTGRFDGRVEGEKVGLRGDFGDHFDDFGDLAAGVGHRGHGFAGVHEFAVGLGDVFAHLGDDVSGLSGVFGVLAGLAAEFGAGGGAGLDAGRLLGGAGGQ